MISGTGSGEQEIVWHSSSSRERERVRSSDGIDDLCRVSCTSLGATQNFLPICCFFFSIDFLLAIAFWIEFRVFRFRDVIEVAMLASNCATTTTTGAAAAEAKTAATDGASEHQSGDDKGQGTERGTRREMAE
jgi:hypothetical protein